MTDDRRPQTAPPDTGKEKSRQPEQTPAKKAPPSKPDDTIEGEGSPGLTITGGGGHA